ncbi:MAG: 6-carboxytetrahydropterin synthase [Acidobacteria bacterium]|nr:6-carboxytetrahydropterin synthase [Acidobacteriota bacterium]
MKAYLTRRYLFSASHRLHNPELGEADNQATYGKCNNPYGHGHNYTLEVTVGGQVDEQTGMICDLAELDRFVVKEVLERFGHENLNRLPQFASVVPTTENLCAELFRILRAFPRAALQKIRLEETMLNSFEYAGGGEMRR